MEGSSRAYVLAGGAAAIVLTALAMACGFLANLGEYAAASTDASLLGRRCADVDALFCEDFDLQASLPYWTSQYTQAGGLSIDVDASTSPPNSLNAYVAPVPGGAIAELH